MISIKHKFILITPPKTGSVSLTDALLDKIHYTKIEKQRENKRREYCFDFGDVFKPLSKHTTIQEMYELWDEEKLGKFDEYKKYISVRNPWERLLSFWKFYNPDDVVSLGDFLVTANTFILKSQLDYMTIDGVRVINDFIRFERLQEDFNKFCEDIDIEPILLPHHNSTEHDHYSTYYNEADKGLIEELYEDEIKLLRYRYDSKDIETI
tara:strand:+ start:194 stop:820 length:627 start_codon:yes stop_codon:yes gene_type:complete